ncbi:hypothetical protein [Xanthomonas arboricola]|uniref:hypothetical protein n=1 Tax=Xanthomonas arboricola TaxID=56448 RepID=UPI000CB9EB9C|nr:hypothetical protein [Xanthomonas arboricola]SOT98059.1 hypothetical protein CFBP6762_01702 [Xanthomonas arboricola pv. fragariae]
MDQNWTHAYFTFQTGTRTFDGIESLLGNVMENFEEITSHPCGSFSDTNDTVCRNAFSDMALVMSYSLLEGFFSVEHAFYIKGKRPDGLVNVIQDVFDWHDMKINDWTSKQKEIDLVRKLRNAVVHNNGIISGSASRDDCERFFGEDIFGGRSYPRLSLEVSIFLVRYFKRIASDYAEHVFMNLKPSGKQEIPTDA